MKWKYWPVWREREREREKLPNVLFTLSMQ